jgi:hypothetical protein
MFTSMLVLVLAIELTSFGQHEAKQGIGKPTDHRGNAGLPINH